MCPAVEATEGNDEVKLVRTADHRSHYMIGAVPQWSENDLRLHIYNEVIEGPGGPFHISSAQLILPRGALPKVIEVLQAAVRSEGEAERLKVATVPKEIAFSAKHAMSERSEQKRKVMKIRRS